MTRRLSSQELAQLPAAIARPGYAREGTRIGIVHLGAGAFHRAHQAVYVDDLLARHPDWAICAVSLHSTEVRDALRPQDGLYTLALLGEPGSLRVIGSIRELLSAREEQSAVLARLADPAVRLVTLTVTEKGYCLAGDDLDLSHPEVVHDLAAPRAPRTTIGHLVAGLALRRERDVAPYTVLSCDNLPGNGLRLRQALLTFARSVDASLAQWIEERGAFPCSTVDSITPATGQALKDRVATQLGCMDAWPVQREEYAQWVIEDNFCNGRPPLELAGATMSRDVAGHDRAKLRLLNGAHSTLAYLGSLLDLGTVADAMREPLLAGFVEQLMRWHIAPAIALPAGLDPHSYIDAILLRFRNPAIRHRLSQIAWDGSQKLPVRLFGTIADALAAGRDIAPLCLPIAGWMQFVRRQARAGVALIDPLADDLARIGHATTGDAAEDLRAFLGMDSMFGQIAGESRFFGPMLEAMSALGDGSAAAVAAALSRYSR